MQVEFLTDAQAAAFGRYAGPLSVAELDRYFFLDDKALGLIAPKRLAHTRLGFAVQLTTLGFLGTFLADPIDVPAEVVDYLAAQLGISDPSCVKEYAVREMTWLEHSKQIRDEYGFGEFAAVADELARWVGDRAWTTGDGPKALFDGAEGWLRERKVVLPGVTTLARLVARVREEGMQRLWDTLAALLTSVQASALESLLQTPAGARVSELERLRRGPTRVSGRAMVAALDRVSEITGIGVGGLDLGAVPHRRVVELARYGLAGKAPALARHPRARRLATLLATVVQLRAKATDDALELFDVLMTTELMGRARRASNEEKVRRYPRVSKDAGKLAAAVGVLLEAAEWGPEATLELLWDAIENVVTAAELRTAVANIVEVVPAPGADPDAEWRTALVGRYPVVRPFLGMLCAAIEFDATAEAAPVLDALRAIPGLIEARPTSRVPAGFLGARGVAVDLVPAAWRRVVFTPGRPEATVDRAGYVFCILALFHERLRRRDIFALTSNRWADPRAKLLTGPAWDAARGQVLNALQIPEDPDALLAGHARALDGALRHVAGRLITNTDVTIDDQGRLHASKIDAIPDPPSLVDLRARCEAMLPNVDIGEAMLEVMDWHPAFLASLTAVSGGQTSLGDFAVSAAAALTAHALNIGFTPVISPGVPALTRNRISHVDQNYLRAGTFAAANAVLVDAQGDVPLARAWGGGLLAAVDGVRFVVPVRSIDARPSPRYFGRGRGVTLLNLVNDQAVGLAGQVVSGTPRDSLHVIDLIYRHDGDKRPEVIFSDTGSYSDMVCGLMRLLGFDYRPQLADLPDAKLWRIDAAADYGPLNTAARGKVDVARIRAHWPDLLRLAASIHTGTVSAHDVLRMLSAAGNPTQLGEALAHYGRIFKTLHVLTYLDQTPYRAQIKAMRNLQEGRHDLARHVFHGQRGDLRRAYHDGMEDQLGALGLVLNCITLWNTVYLDAALTQLRAQGYPVRDEDVARLSPYMRRHLNVHGHYSFLLPDFAGLRRALRDPDADTSDN
ncbi:MAG: Tn3 family transposase [Pedococcus sp.]